MVYGGCTYRGEHCIMNGIVKSLFWAPESNITLYVHFNNKKMLKRTQ